MQTPDPPLRHYVLGAPVDTLDLAGALARVAGWLDAPDDALRHVVTVNPEFVMAARRDPRFAAALRASALATADGVGIGYAERLLGLPVAPRVTGVELVEGLAALRCPAARLFLLGAAPGVADAAAARLRARFPGVQIVGAYAGSPAPADWPAVAAQLRAARPTILLVAFGHPRQDLWIAARRAALTELGVVTAAGVGGAFDYLSGRVPRAPAVLRRLGLEWLYRLIRQPWRWRRQLALPRFVALVLWTRARGVGRDLTPQPPLQRGEGG
jgi:N-acetylglucosaminyldiphosphoundecaprenol N-acetyl-beta-D-mannosaminyltransferase